LKKATIRIEDRIAERLQSEMGNLTAACTWLLEAYDAVRTYGLQKLKSIFTLDELKLILDAENGLIFSPRLIDGYMLHIQDAMNIDRLDQKWSVDASALIPKLESLCRAELVIMHEWMNYYWSGRLKTRPTMEEYLS
jgi:hypothetical protein